jgi:hypothetical protein
METWALKSRGFRGWLSKRFYENDEETLFMAMRLFS